MIGCLLIAIGTITVGLGGTMTRLGHREYLYIPMAIGVAIIFLGYLQTRAPSAKPVAPATVPAAAPVSNGVASANGRSANGRRPDPVSVMNADPGLAFIEARLAELDDAALSELCREWSADRPAIDVLDRAGARRAWTLRTCLSAAAQTRFDALAVPTRAQLTELYHEVMLAAAESPVNR
jgi:hypothetical protein